jgi:hypothetical protein
MDAFPHGDDGDDVEPIPDIDAQHSELVEFLLHSAEMRKTAKNSLKAGLYAGGGALAGALCLGPLGGLLGGVCGSIVGYVQSDPYDGVLSQVTALDPYKKERLVADVRGVLAKAGVAAVQFQTADAFRGALVEMAQRREVRDQVWKACVAAVK